MRNKWVLALVALVIGVALVWFLRPKNMRDSPRLERFLKWWHLYGDGDPPVLVSDGSFFAESDNGWSTANTTTLIPKGSKLVTCGNMGGLQLVEFCDGTYPPVDVSPQTGDALNMTIMHHGHPVTAVTDTAHANLTIYDGNAGDGWGPPSGSWFYYRVFDKNPDHIDFIRYIDHSGQSIKVPSSGVAGDGAYVAFCYQ
jgi:hypothetical protein